VHDPLGRRIAKKVDGTIIEKYLWQGLTRLLAVYDGSDNLIMRFEYADGRMPAAMTKGGNTYYLAYDQVGSLRIVADNAGNVVKRIEYDSFGNIIDDTNPSFEIPFGFAGGLHDRDTGLVRFGYRDYDPDVGRWTAKDPILFAGGDTDLYGYCLNDPVNLIDPTGEFGFVIKVAIKAATVATASYLTYKFGKSIRDSVRIGSIIQKLEKEKSKALKNSDFLRAGKIDTAIEEVRRNGFAKTMEVIANSPPGTTITGPIPASWAELAESELYTIILNYYVNNNSCP